MVRKSAEKISHSYEESIERMYKKSMGKSLSDALCVSDTEGISNEHCSPLIIALKQLQHKHLLKKTIKKWIYNLADLFNLTDEDKNGYIDVEEYRKMISTLNLSENLKYSLISKFEEIDEDKNGYIDVEEYR